MIWKISVDTIKKILDVISKDGFNVSINYKNNENGSVIEIKKDLSVEDTYAINTIIARNGG